MQSTSIKAIRLALLLLTTSMFFVSCDKNKEDEMTPSLDDENIEIGDGSIFNQTKFKASFEQSFRSDSRWETGYSNEIVDGKIMSTDLNLKVYGSFGDKIMTSIHVYNSIGVITSSVRQNFLYDEEITHEFTYNEEGYISTITKIKEGQIKDVVTQKYNELGQLISKKHDAEYDRYGELEEFSYNSEGHVTTFLYTRQNPEGEISNREVVYSYSGENMIESKRDYNTGSYEKNTYTYDSEGKITSRILTDVYDETTNHYVTNLTYDENTLTETSYNYNDSLRGIHVYNNSLTTPVSNLYFSYDYQSGQFTYAKKSIKGSNGKTEHKEVYHGTADNLELVGKSQIMEYHNPSLKKTKEKVMTPDGATLYNVEFEIAYNEESDFYFIQSTTYYDVDGNVVDKSNISESWVHELVR